MISVIIPVFNSKQYLRRCINSVILQTYGDLEIVLVDDGSTDGSGNLCDEFAASNASIKVFHTANQGASLARRFGLEQASGEYVTFVDSDDYVEDDYLEMLYKAMNQDDVKISACDYIQHNEGSSPIIDKKGRVVLLDDKALHERFFNYQFWGFWGKIYHKSVFDGIFFPAFTINEDYLVMAQVFNRYKRMAYVPMGLYHYVIHEEGLSHQKLSIRMFDEYYNQLWVRDFYRHNNPLYLRQAEARLTETCVSLVGTVQREDKKREYREIENEMRNYLRRNILSILTNPFLRNSLKFFAIKYCYI